jgi:hypothetical protein
VPRNFCYRSTAVTRLADDFDSVVTGEDCLETRTHQVVVVDEQHAHRSCAHAPSPP